MTTLPPVGPEPGGDGPYTTVSISRDRTRFLVPLVPGGDLSGPPHPTHVPFQRTPPEARGPGSDGVLIDLIPSSIWSETDPPHPKVESVRFDPGCGGSDVGRTFSGTRKSFPVSSYSPRVSGSRGKWVPVRRTDKGTLNDVHGLGSTNTRAEVGPLGIPSYPGRDRSRSPPLSEVGSVRLTSSGEWVMGGEVW